MTNSIRSLKALADENRLRLLMLLKEKELFVCQIMAIVGISQPLVSRNLALLEREGLLASRRDGKQVFYRLRKDLPPPLAALVEAIAASTRGEGVLASDRKNLGLFCRRFQRGTACDMATVREFIAFRTQNKIQGVHHGKTGQKSVH
jgi:DNA-binding transcriptional ArsR family regulator